MKFDLHTHETLVLLAGVLGLVEQEAARLFLAVEPNSLMSGTFGSLVLASIGVGTVRGLLERKNGNGNGSK